MILITANTVNAMSMFDIFIHLHSINEQPHNKESTRRYQSNPEGMFGRLIRYKVTDNHKSHHELAYIIVILGEVVYLLFVHHEDIMRATDVPEE